MTDTMREVFLILGNPERERAFAEGIKAAQADARALVGDAIKEALIGGNHLASYLWSVADPTKITDYDDALHKHGQPYADIWVANKSLRALTKAQAFMEGK